MLNGNLGYLGLLDVLWYIDMWPHDASCTILVMQESVHLGLDLGFHVGLQQI